MQTRLWLLAVALLLPVPARGNMPADATTRLEDLVKRGEVSAEERKALADGIAKWADVRKRKMDQLVEIIGDTSPSNTDQESKWVSVAKDARSELNQTIGNALQNVREPKEPVRNLKVALQQEEDKVFEALEQSKIGTKRDFIVKNMHKVKEMTQLLDTKWEGFVYQDNSLDEVEKAAVDEMKRIVQEVISEVVRDQSTFVSKWTLYATEKKYSKPVTGIKDALIESAKVMAQKAIKNSAAYRQARQRLEEAVRGERGGVYVLFRDVRKDTDLFVRENQYPFAKQAYEDAKQAFDKVSSAATTSAQKGDVSVLSSKVLDRLSAHLKETETVQNEFIRKHEKKFFGPVGPDIKNALAETEQWKQWESQFQAYDLDAKLREFRDAQNRIVDVTASDLDDEETRELVKGSVKEDVERFVKASEELQAEYDLAIKILQAREDTAKDFE